MARMRSRIASVPRMRLTSVLSRATSAAGVPPGAYRPNTVSASKPLRPTSSSVGASGNSGLRDGLPTAIRRSRPARMCGTAMPGSNRKSIWPPSRSVSAGAAPRYGMCTANTPAMLFIISAARCGLLPLPGLP
jgi:hypothetical protein